MQSSQFTDERLKYWLDANQVQRERLCAAVLALSGNFANIKLRRPKGGPDGGRDLEAILDNKHMTLGAVGFRNSAKDSAADKRWVKKKFSLDLNAALQESPQLSSFVFFTNVDLTPKEEAELKSIAGSKGVAFTEVFYRERIRLLLDSVEGLAARYLYLGISLSEAEQAAFFGRFGKQLEKLIAEQFSQLDQKLSRVEFLSESQWPITRFCVIVKFIKPLSRLDLEGFGFLLGLFNRSNMISLNIYGRSFSVEEDMIGLANRVLEKTLTDSKIIGGGSVYGRKESIKSAAFGDDFLFHRQTVFRNLIEMNGQYIDLYLTSHHADCIENIKIIANNYLLFDVYADDLLFVNQGGKPYLENDEVVDVESHADWVSVLLKGESDSVRDVFRFDFTKNTPKKLTQSELEQYWLQVEREIMSDW